ncbi:RNA-binding protein [Schizosaccharomyces japonicus yFS275]|uniref:Mitochondrial escape protein 2 n=1 Tax=Schizosaccharomyces japonicus (strain yFS275 / FY16936) TaxID=402676 RepID=B6K356_SCHJY|nr:RNA-binding protein [Schizosaccharomyces japonicus yFS275]EEB07913.1 RNA-binding protein [Schizosaccharomyces japonicus yFS275]
MLPLTTCRSRLFGNLLWKPAFAKRYVHALVKHDLGHLHTKSNQELFFLDNLVHSPSIFQIQKYVSMLFQGNLRKQIYESFPKNTDLKLSDVLFRWQDGGAFLIVDLPDKPTDLESVSELLKKQYDKEPVKSILHPFSTPKLHAVHGQPWLQDLYVLPSRTLRVTFDGPTLSEEELYSVFRAYGKLAFVKIDGANTASLKYNSLRGATSALNCLHGYKYKHTGTRFSIRFVSKKRFSSFFSWIFSHPRLSIPLGAALLAAITASLFDPIRQFFVEANIRHARRLRELNPLSWLKKNSLDFVIHPFQSNKPAAGTSPLWRTRERDRNQLEEWLNETFHSFIVIQGPRGSGKRELIDKVLETRDNVLILDCDKLFAPSNRAVFVNVLASQVGYFPLFNKLNSLSSFVDVAAQGLIGQKIGFSSSVEAQATRILGTVQNVLRSIALSKRSKDRDADLDETEYLDVHTEKLPIVVFDNFQLRKLTDPLQRLVASWAGSLVRDRVARVVMLTPDIGGAKSLEQFVDGRENKSLLFGDSDPALAKSYVLYSLPERLRTKEVEKRLEQLLPRVGGRLRDLDLLVRRLILSKADVDDAVNSIVNQNASDILQTFLRPPSSSLGNGTSAYSPEQAWTVIQTLANNGRISYHKLMTDPIFANNEEILRSLEESDLIIITTKNARPETVLPGKPVYVSAFHQLLSDPVTKTTMESLRLTALIKHWTKTLQNSEDELKSLADVYVGEGIKTRAQYLNQKILKCQTNIEMLEKKLVAEVARLADDKL